ncbi:aminotransferase class III-fold pyridoxal phosphate-dependent enzyme [bacterium]|nr:MAG: aminotransferase class III-fold pyridoxal phosphate-dependent enzyme [bacterium]
MDIYEQYSDLTPGSSILHNHAIHLFPGGICHNLRLFDPYPIYPRRAVGGIITDVDGRDIVDLWMGHFTMIFGHNFATVKNAVVNALDGGWHWGMPHEKEVRLADEIMLAAPAIRKLRFCCTGTEATMYAVRLARAFTGKGWVLKVAGGWHGASTDLSFAVKHPFGEPEGAGLPEPDRQGVAHLQFNDIEASKKVIEVHQGHTAAIIVEPMLGAGGFIPADPEYLKFLRQACDDIGAVLIFDEIITGFRFRYGILADEYGVRPDLVTLGKIVGGGFPIGLYGGRADIMELANPKSAARPGRPVLVGGGTFSANPVTMAAGLATLDVLRTQAGGIYSSLAAKGEKLRKGITERFDSAGVPAECTGKGSLFMTHILKDKSCAGTLRSPADIAEKTLAKMPDREMKISLLNHGVFSVHGGGSVCTAHSETDVEKVLDGYEGAAKDLKKILSR